MKSSSSLLRAAQDRQRIETMREIADVAIHVFHDRGFHEVTIETVAQHVGVSAATIYRRFGTKSNLVCWQPDERQALQGLLERLGDGMGILDAALDLAERLPDAALTSVEATGRLRLDLISTHPETRCGGPG